MSPGIHPAHRTGQAAGLQHSPRAGFGYGLLGLPLAFVALPLYVHLPNLYASRYGLSLAALGGVELAANRLRGGHLGSIAFLPGLHQLGQHFAVSL